MFSESVKGLWKSLSNTLVFITVVTSTIFLCSLFSSPRSPSLYWSHVQSHMKAVFLWAEKSLRVTGQNYDIKRE